MARGEEGKVSRVSRQGVICKQPGRPPVPAAGASGAAEVGLPTSQVEALTIAGLKHSKRGRCGFILGRISKLDVSTSLSRVENQETSASSTYAGLKSCASPLHLK